MRAIRTAGALKNITEELKNETSFISEESGSESGCGDGGRPGHRAIAARNPVAARLELSEESGYDIRRRGHRFEARRGDHREQVPNPRVCGRRNRARTASAGRR